MSDCKRCERLERALSGLVDGLDDYWVTTEEGKSALLKAMSALAAEPEPPCEVCGGSGLVPCELKWCGAHDPCHTP